MALLHFRLLLLLLYYSWPNAPLSFRRDCTVARIFVLTVTAASANGCLRHRAGARSVAARRNLPGSLGLRDLRHHSGAGGGGGGSGGGASPGTQSQDTRGWDFEFEFRVTQDDQNGRSRRERTQVRHERPTLAISARWTSTASTCMHVEAVDHARMQVEACDCIRAALPAAVFLFGDRHAHGLAAGIVCLRTPDGWCCVSSHS